MEPRKIESGEKSPLLQMVEAAQKDGGVILSESASEFFDRIRKAANEAILSMILWNHRN